MNNKISLDTSKDEDLSKVIDAITTVKNEDVVKSNSIITDDFDKVVKRLCEKNFRIAVIGEFSSGKSTFLNALIGKDILKHGRLETTATITEIKNDITVGDELKFDAYYVNGRLEKDISIDKLEEYTSTSSHIHSVADEIEKVVIRDNIFNIDYHVTFIDTPGLNGVADKHRDKTIELIKNAHACIYLLQVRGIGKSDIAFIKLISRYQYSFIFVQNFIDEINTLEGETVSNKICAQENILREKVFKDRDDIDYRVIGISSSKALISRNYQDNEYDKCVLTDEKRKDLYIESNFENLIQGLEDLIRKNNKNKIQIQSTIQVAIKLMEQLLDIVNFRKQQVQIEWSNSPEARKKELLTKQRNLLEISKKDYLENLDNFIDSQAADIRKSIIKNIDTGKEDIINTIDHDMQELTEVDKFEEYVNDGNMIGTINKLVYDLEDYNNKYMNMRFNNILKMALLRIKDYIGNVTNITDIKELSITLSISNNDVFDFTQEENEEKKLQKDKARTEVCIEKNKKHMSENQGEIENRKQEILRLDKTKCDKEIRKEIEIDSLGKKPKSETKYMTRTRKEYRGGLGFIDALKGPKKIKESVPYTDDSNVRKWEINKSNIETKYRNEISKIDALIDDAKISIEENKKEIDHIKRENVENEVDLNRTRALLEETIENNQIKKQKAKTEYLGGVRRSLIEKINRYLSDNIVLKFDDNFTQVISENRDSVRKQVHSLFEEYFTQKIKSLNEVNNEKKEDFVDIDKTIEIINQSKNVLEAYYDEL